MLIRTIKHVEHAWKEVFVSARNSLVSSATSNDHATVASKLSSTAQRLGTFVIGVLLAVSLVPIAPVSAYADTSASAPAAAADNPTEVSEPAPTDVFVETSMEAPGPASAETSAVSSTQSDNHAVSVILLTMCTVLLTMWIRALKTIVAGMWTLV